MLIEIVVIAFADLGAAARPDRLHRVQRLGFNLGFARLIVWLTGLLRRAFIDNGVSDEIRILVNNRRQLPPVGIVFNPILGVSWFEVQRDIGSAASLFRFRKRVGCVARRLPSRGGSFAC